MEGPSGRHSRAEKDEAPSLGRGLRLGGCPGGANLRATPGPCRGRGDKNQQVPLGGVCGLSLAREKVPVLVFANGRALGLLEPVRGEQEGLHPSGECGVRKTPFSPLLECSVGPWGSPYLLLILISCPPICRG